MKKKKWDRTFTEEVILAMVNTWHRQNYSAEGIGNLLAISLGVFHSIEAEND